MDDKTRCESSNPGHLNLIVVHISGVWPALQARTFSGQGILAVELHPDLVSGVGSSGSETGVQEADRRGPS